jgi:hypothetical protein
MPRDLFIHVGASKSGTSSLQVGLRASQRALAKQGLGLPYASRTARASRVLRPLGWEVVEGFPAPVDHERLDQTVAGIAEIPGDRLLITIEDLAELDEERIEAFVGRLEKDPDLRVHVIVTIRDWTRTLPSDWQQQLKRRMTTDYATYLAQVRDGVGADADIFRMRQDLAGICSRWATKVPPERIHVIPVGTPKQDGDSIFRDVAAVVGVDHAAIDRPRKSVNTSYGYLECEVLRRLNISLGPRLRKIRTEYNPGVRRILAKGSLSRSSQQRVTLPPEHLGWVQEEMRRQVDAVRELGVQEHGDLDLLVPGDDAAAPLPEIDDAELARAAIDTLAAFATLTFKQRRELERELRLVRRRATRAERRVARLQRRRAAAAPPAALTARAARVARRAVRRARGSLRR